MLATDPGSRCSIVRLCRGNIAHVSCDIGGCYSHHHSWDNQKQKIGCHLLGMSVPEQPAAYCSLEDMKSKDTSVLEGCSVLEGSSVLEGCRGGWALKTFS